MTESEEPLAVDKFTVHINIGVTVKVNDQDWLKPSVGSSVSWPGLPEPDQIEAAVEYQQSTVVEPTLNQMVKLIQEHMLKIGLK